MKKMNEHERLAKNNIEKAFDSIIGDYYNMFMDDCLDTFDPEEVKNEIYESAMVDLYDNGGVFYDRAPKEIRFAGSNFCKKLIDELFDKNEDVMEIIQHFS